MTWPLMTRTAKSIILPVLLATSALLGAAPAQAQTFSVNFASHTGPDLVKNKFGVYQTPFWFLSNNPSSYNMTPLLQEAGVKDLRYEMGWGKPDTYAYDQINGTAANPTIDFTRLDPFLQQMAAAGTTPLLAMTYDPLPLKTGTDWQRWKDVPSNLSAWQSINQRYADHYSNTLGIKGIHYEMWNEPDLPGDGGKVFFNGTPGDYGNVFNYGVAGIRAGASDATVGGPAIAYDTSYLTGSGMLNNSPNFVSFHAYANYPSQISGVEQALGNSNLPLYLTEYASYNTFSPTGPNSTHAAAAAFFEDVKGMLTYPNLQKVYWAQWIDDSLGMLTSGLHRKAIFNAYKLYQTYLPVTRNAVSPDGSGGVDLMASSSSSSAGVAAWNNNTSSSSVTLNLTNLPGLGGTVSLYRIDSQNASYVDNNASENLTVNGSWNYTGTSTSWTGSIPGQSVVYLKVTPTSAVLPTIANGSFETPSVGSANFQYTPAGASWTFASTAGIQSNGSGWGAPNAPDGTQTAMLQGYPGGVGSISQSVNFSSPGTYILTFQAARRSGQVQPIKFSVDGTQIGGLLTPAGNSFALLTATFTISTAGAHTLTLAATSTSADLTSFVDQVSLSVPVPTIANGSFETPSVGTANFQYAPSGATWSFASTAGIQSNGSGWAAPNAPNGTQTAFLQGYSGGVGSMSQSVTFAGPGNFALTFQAAQRSGQVQPIKFSVDGTQVGGLLTPAGSSFGLLTSGTFTISTAGAHTLTLSATSTSADLSSFVDQVSLVAK